VNQQNATSLEPKNQILAATLQALDDLALEFRRHLERLEGAHEPSVEDLDTVESTTDHGRLQLSTNGLDFGKLGHVARR
jgi:hypothetical protein